ncbi:MAG: hypothetical protein Q9180_000095 [Flavoplaca navasiana]
MFSRRNPATYGKTTRRPLTHCFDASSLDPPTPSSGITALQRGRLTPKVQDICHQFHPGCDRSPPEARPESSSPEISSDRYTVSTLSETSRKGEISKRHQPWDSSPDEAHKDVATIKASVRKKNKKLIATARPQNVTPQSSPDRRNMCNTHNSPMKTSISSNSADRVDDHEILEPSSTSRRALMDAPPESVHTPSKYRAVHGQESSPVRAGHVECSLPPMPCTPLHRRGLVKETTPYQRELWSMLLPDHTKLRPGDLSRTSPAPSSTLEAGSALEPKRRRRLVDELQAPLQTAQSRKTTPSGLTVLSDLKEKLAAGQDTDPSSSSCERSLMTNIIPRATYSSQRSYLAPDMVDETSTFGVPLNDGGQNSKKRLRPETMSLETEYPESVHESEFDGSQSNTMRTVHELRESGENARHLNDIEALFDDIDGQSLASISLKRRRLLDLTHRLHDPTFCRLMFDQGFDHRLLAESASRGNDAVADALLAVAVLYLVATPSRRQATSIACDLQIAEFFAAKLNCDQDLLGLIRNRRSNLSKQDQLDLKGYFFDGLLNSPIWRSGAPVRPSVRLIALQGLEYFIRTRREIGCKIEILPLETIWQLVQVLVSAQRTATPGVDLLLEVRLAISILESYTISGADHGDQQWTESLLKPLTTVLSWLTFVPHADGAETRRLTIRLYLNLTNNNPRLCEAFAGHEVLQAMLSVVDSHFQMLSDRKQGLSGSHVLDTLILALGTLINLVEWSPTVYSEEETSSNVAFGYLSVLLSYLCVEKHARQMVASRLPGGTLQALLNTVVEFLQYHRQIEDDMDQEDGETDLKASFISRLEATVTGLRQRRAPLDQILQQGPSQSWTIEKEETLMMPTPPKQRKVAIVGSRSVGKSSLTVRFVERHFVESYYPTIENTFSHTIKSRGQEFATEIVDTAGQDEYTILNSKHFIGIHGYMLVYSVASKQSLEMVRILRDKILNHLGADWVPMMIVGNKCDLKPEQKHVATEDGRQMAEEFKCGFTEASARLDINVSKAFEQMIGEIEKSQNPAEPAGGNKCCLM